jgi:hypothetical protein
MRKLSIRRLVAAGLAIAAIAMAAPATSLASNPGGGGGPRPVSTE